MSADSRHLARRLVVLAAIVVSVVAGVAVFWLVTTSVPGISSRSQITAIEASSYPEGPSESVTNQSAHFAAAVEAVPVPLPRRRLDLSQCKVGGRIVIVLVNGERASYGPCKLPVSIQRVGCLAAGDAPDCYNYKYKP